MNYFKIIFGLCFISPIIFAQTSPVQSVQANDTGGGVSDSKTRSLMEERRVLQSRFMVAQSKFSAKTEESPSEIHKQMEEINNDIDKLAQKVITYEASRSSLWSSGSFWNKTKNPVNTTSTASYAVTIGNQTTVYTSTTKSSSPPEKVVVKSGPYSSAKYVIQKLNDQISKTKELRIPTSGPYKKSDFNESQKVLDSIRTALDLDIEINAMAKLNLNK